MTGTDPLALALDELKLRADKLSDKQKAEVAEAIGALTMLLDAAAAAKDSTLGIQIGPLRLQTTARDLLREVFSRVKTGPLPLKKKGRTA